MICARLVALSFISLTSATGSLAQHAGGHASAQPYSGIEQRAIKSLSDEQISDLRAGRGMGFALAAELNGYP